MPWQMRPGMTSRPVCRDTRPLVGRATVRAPGHCGELVQGMLDGHYFLVTCPIDFFARVQVELYSDSRGVQGPATCPKALAAVQAALAHLDRPDLGARLTIHNPIPRSKGMGSSTADVAAAIAATGLALGRPLTAEIVGRIAVSVEPSDGLMFPGIARFDHRQGCTFELLGPPPPMEIVALDFGGQVDTLEFNGVDRRELWQSLSAEAAEGLRLVRQGVRQGDPSLVGRGATVSAQANQRVLFKPQLERVLEFAQYVGAVGVNVGHSGTVIGVLLDARSRRGKSTFHHARRAFPDAEMVQHFRLLGGGLQAVPE
ncbi:MAG: GHMP kinase [Dehalococcoidia bacterium]|nr:GHMP kinase [Dehalococcoidia bacterium]MSQ16567.1 GHMP kinase [Dehalococcoidia bacterium]